MIQYLARFVQRTRRPITILVSVVGGGYLAVSYLRSKLDVMQDSLTRTRWYTENLRRRFEQNQQDCSFTVLALIPTLGKQVIQVMNVERLAELLNHTKSRQPQTTKPPIPPSETPDHNDNDNNHNNAHTIENTNPDHHLNNNTAIKNPVITIDHNVQDEKSSNSAAPATQDLSDLLVRPDGSRIQKRSEIWREMMIVSFSRLFTCLYGLTLLTLQTHLQLGLLGRDSYLSSIVSNENLDRESDFAGDERLDRLYEEQSDDNPLNSLTERRYLTFSYWYLHQGWLVLSERTRKAVEDILSSRNLKDLVSVSDLQEIFDLIRKSVELESDGTEFKFTPILLPTNSPDELQTLKLGGMPTEECEVDGRLRALLDETQDFIDCPDFRLVLSSAMARIVDLSISNIARNASLDRSDISPPREISALARFHQIDSDDPSLSQEPAHTTARIVDILPVISKESLSILNVIPNEYIETICETPELKEFSSVIYTTFDSLAQSESAMT